MELDVIKSYLRIDFEDDDNLLMLMLETADLFLEGAIKHWDKIKKSEKYSQKVIILIVAVIQNLYDNRGLSIKEANFDRVITSLINQLDLLNESDLQ